MNFEERPNINLGSGNRILKSNGWMNHDRFYHRPEIDCACDLNCMPYPWLDDTFVTVRMFDVLEHLDRPVDVLNELWRILKPEGMLHMRVLGEFSTSRWIDPTHQRPYNIDSFDFLDPNTHYGKHFGFYTTRRWKIILKRVDDAKSHEYKMKPRK